MKAFVLRRYGKKRSLRLADIPAPDLLDDEVLVQIHAAGVNLLDSKIRDGEFKLILPYRLPLILGHDVAGEVVGVGKGVRQFKPGDKVYARTDDFRIGTFAEFVPVKEASLALKPTGLTMEEAASIPLVALTAWQALVAMTPVFERFRCGFVGKCSPVHFFWGSFDLAVTRFSGRRAPVLMRSRLKPIRTKSSATASGRAAERSRNRRFMRTRRPSRLVSRTL